MINKSIPEEKHKENIESVEEFIGMWLIENTSIQGDQDGAFMILHYGLDAHVAKRYIAKMMADYVKEKGYSECKSDASDWQLKFEIVANALSELVKLKEIKENVGETPEYLLTGSYRVRENEKEP